MSDFLNESLKGRTLFAIPKKGRLYEKCLELLAGADIQFTRSHRLDVCLVRNHNMALVFLPAADIPRFVGEGNVHLGITGQDMVAEASAQKLVTEVLPLGFGKCKLQIQVPEKGPIKTVDDLVGKKIVTSFEVLAGQYFAELDQKSGLAPEKKTLIEYVGGSVEAACALGLADGIVDLVESGETMRAAGLTAISTLLTSQAVLIRSNKSSDGPTTSLITRITSRIAGVIAAGRYVLVQYNIRRDVVDEATKITPGRRAATVSPLDDPEWVAVSSMVLKAEVADVMDRLQAIGAADILNVGLTNCRVD
ncbi:ATP phosphoribosyltransferase [Microbotryum lychnidis-dioicae p1A1 Lamole]|uniref:ATP phosphoribosyltransferase n=2 Tax=Microbotryum TaxID=34416 RepID=U5HAB4_USTV1|nr:ATP phosphoribosyltransferase [Microbotryum lychnidis-dioicae p1A1 Lamole]SGY18866.1 BQ5605_C014g07497 [Microbotryum silenes-dioicae]|eukprot:KDE05456.1 ATP phosphoribosyltransferase [Microbotryum lychnidis-dioicae p1A1 Lamole]